MASQQDSTDWGCVLPLVIFAAIGLWWWNDHKKPTIPPVVAATATPQPVDENLVTAAPTVPKPISTPSPPPPLAHRYAFAEGDAYGYIAAVSEEDRKRGKAAGDVLMFRYAGYWDHEFHLEELNANGDITGVDTCARPCVAIKSYQGGQMERLAYNPDSVIGAAFDDAMSGRLKRKAPRQIQPAPKATAPNGYISSPSADDTANTATE